MTSESVSRALLGVIILESLEKKKQRIKEVKRDRGFKGEKRRGFTQILLKSFGLRTRKRMKKC